jgi:hypothetical protein
LELNGESGIHGLGDQYGVAAWCVFFIIAVSYWWLDFLLLFLIFLFLPFQFCRVGDWRWLDFTA